MTAAEQDIARHSRANMPKKADKTVNIDFLKNPFFTRKHSQATCKVPMYMYKQTSAQQNLARHNKVNTPNKVDKTVNIDFSKLTF